MTTFPSNITTTSPEFMRLLNERLTDLAAVASRPLEITSNLNAQGYRVTNIAPARGAGDALSLAMGDLRYLKRSEAPGVVQQVQQITNTTVQTVTGAAGSLALTVPGVLAIQSSAAPLFAFPDARTVQELRVLLKEPPTGGDLICEIEIGGTLWATVTVAAGEVEKVLNGSDLAGIAANALVVLNITAVGLTFSGADLSVLIRT